MAAFAVAGEVAAESRFDSRSGQAVLPMVGRDQELALLTQRWEQAIAGEGQGMLLVGEAGIGKSRITFGAARSSGRHSPHPPALPVLALPRRQRFVPVTQQIARAADLDADDGHRRQAGQAGSAARPGR